MEAHEEGELGNSIYDDSENSEERDGGSEIYRINNQELNHLMENGENALECPWLNKSILNLQDIIPREVTADEKNPVVGSCFRISLLLDEQLVGLFPARPSPVGAGGNAEQERVEPVLQAEQVEEEEAMEED